MGRLIVTILDACDLEGFKYIARHANPINTAAAFAKGSHVLGAPNAFVELELKECVVEHASEDSKPSRTSTIKSKKNPEWDETFDFLIHTEKGSDPILKCIVYDEKDESDEGEDKLLGITAIKLSNACLLASVRKRRYHELTLRNADRREVGKVWIAIRWEPKDIVSKLSRSMQQWNSPQACQVLGAATSITSAVYMLSAREAGWLSRGHVDIVELPGASMLTLFSSVCAFGAGVVQLLGTFGFLGNWNPGFPGFDVERDDEAESPTEAPCVKMVGGLMSGMKVYLEGDWIPVPALEVLCWLQHLGTFLFSLSALALALRRRRQMGLWLADGWFLALNGILLEGIACVCFKRAADLMDMVGRGSDRAAHSPAGSVRRNPQPWHQPSRAAAAVAAGSGPREGDAAARDGEECQPSAEGGDLQAPRQRIGSLAGFFENGSFHEQNVGTFRRREGGNSTCFSCMPWVKMRT